MTDGRTPDGHQNEFGLRAEVPYEQQDGSAPGWTSGGGVGGYANGGAYCDRTRVRAKVPGDIRSKRDKDGKDDGQDEDADKDDYGDDNKQNKDKGSKKYDKNDDNKNGGKKKSRWPIILLIVVVTLAIIGGVIYWFLTKDQQSTDDAYTEGNAISIVPKVSGYVVERRVRDNSFIKAGELMVLIDQRDYLAAREQSQAQVEVAQAQLENAQVQLDLARVTFPARLAQAEAQRKQAEAQQQKADADLRRQRSVDPRATTRQDIDAAVANARVAGATTGQQTANVETNRPVPLNIKASEAQVKQSQASLAQAKAQLGQAELNLSYTEVRAPQDGLITRRNVDVGTYAQAGQQLFYLVNPLTWVTANFKETELTRMRVGQRVDITVDAYPDLKIRGYVDSFQQGSGARFTTFPTENATGNYVKIVRRVPVKIVIDSGIDQSKGLPLGLSVEPTVHLK